jgi:aminoglycoside phosphotransferase (APT) family kinase protein
VLRTDPRLPSVDIAWSTDEIATLLNQCVLPALAGGDQVSAVSIDELSYAPGVKCVGLYSLRFCDALAAPTRWAVVSFAKSKKLQAMFSHHVGDGAVAASGPRQPRAVLLPEIGCLVELFPTDWGLPSLASAIDPVAVASLLSEISAGAEVVPPPDQATVDVLRYKAHRRCVMRFAPNSEPRLNGVVAKLYRQASRGQEVWRTLGSLRAQAPANQVVIPRPLGVVDAWNLLLMERVAGRSVEQELEGPDGSGRLGELAVLAAEALTALHGLWIESPAARFLADDLEGERIRAAQLHLVAPTFAHQVQTLLDSIAELVVQSTCPEPSLIHGDFAPSQLLLDGRRVAIVDFDTVTLGDPAIDIGNFMAESRRLALVPGQIYLKALAAKFLAEYRALAWRPGLGDRVRLAQAIALVRMALTSFQRAPRAWASDGPGSLSAQLIQEAATCLGRQGTID